MWIYDLENLRFLAVNDSAVQKYGYKHDEFLGMTIADIRPEEDHAALERNVAAVTDGRSESGVWRHCLKSGQIIFVDISGHTLTYEGRRAELISARDVSRIVNSEQIAKDALAREEVTSRELRRTKRLLEIAGRAAQFGAWRYDLNADRQEWSSQTARIHDEPEGFSPSPEQGLKYYPPEHRDRIKNLFHACIHNGKSFDDVLEIITAKGRRIWVRATGEPERDGAGTIVAVQGTFQDISELVTAQKSANELSNRLTETLENINDAFYLLDNEWRFTFLNKRAEQLLQRSREELLGAVVWDKFPEAAWQIREPFELALREDRAVRFKNSYPPLGTWLEVNATPTLAGLAVYFRDITQERDRDAQLRLLEISVGKLNDILLITEAEPFDNPEGPRIVYVNDAFERRTGFTRDEVIGKTPRILQGPKTQRDELDRIRLALEAWQPVRSELINYTKSGEEFWLELDIVPLADEAGWFTHWIAVERDITDRKKWQNDLEASEQRFRLVSQSAGTAIWDWSVPEGTQWWSDGLEEIFGHRQDPDHSIPNVWRAHVHPDDAAPVEEAKQKLASGEIEALRETYRFRRADGSWAWVEDRAFAIRNADGVVIRVLGSLTDISERLDLERQLRQMQKLEAIGQLTGGIAHDFNNILAIIIGNAELLAKDLERQTDLKDMADQIIGAALRGADLTSRLLAIARKQVLEPVVTDLNAAVRSMAPLLERGLGESVEIVATLTDELWLVEIDPGQLESALLNLAINARDAMPAGGKLTIETCNVWIDAETAGAIKIEEGRFAVIAVTDTGCGIAVDDVERVLEPFFSTKGHGSGLGLSMVFGFAKQSGGHLKIHSELDEGTTVKLYFPQAAPDATEARPETSIEAMPKGGGELVLVVEDDPDVRRNVVVMVRSLGYGVVEAQNAAGALDLLDRQAEIALLFTDVVMPGDMNGRELAEIAVSRRPDLRVLFTSGYTENAIVHQGRLDPGVELLSKPYRRQALAMKLRAVLDRSNREE
jgi:PAS domain S-box-containing protein